MKDDSNILQELYRSASSARRTLQRALESAEDIKLVEDIKDKLNRYAKICSRVRKELKARGEVPKDKDTFSGFSQAMGTRLNLLVDNTPSNIAQMLIHESNTGIIDINRELNREKDISGSPKEIANELLLLDEKNINDMKKYL